MADLSVPLEDGAVRITHEVKILIVKEPMKMALLSLVVAEDSALGQLFFLCLVVLVHVPSRCNAGGRVNGENINHVSKIQRLDHLGMHVRVASVPCSWQVSKDALDASEILSVLLLCCFEILPIVSDCVQARVYDASKELLLDSRCH